MSGTRLSSFREGDRSEYLATYFFSALGLVTSVPRQEDIGYDLVCSLANQDTGLLTFENQYLVSIKSISKPNIDLVPSKNFSCTESDHLLDLPHLMWLFALELPLLLAVVDKASQEILVYSTLPYWFILSDFHDCGSLSLIPRIKPNNRSDLSADVEKPIKGKKTTRIPSRFHYKVYLGFPIARATIQELGAIDKLQTLKRQIKHAVHFGRLTAQYFNMGAPFGFWYSKTYQNGSNAQIAFHTKGAPEIDPKDEFILGNIAPVLITLALKYKSSSRNAMLDIVLELLKRAPSSEIPCEIKRLFPQLQ